MTHYERLKRKRLGDILVDEGLASKESVIQALQEQQRTGVLLSDILLESREISEYDLARALVEQYQTPYLDLKGYTFHKDLIASYPGPLLHRAKVIPLDRFGKQVCFACQEVPPGDVVSQLKNHAQGGLFFYVASAMEIRACLKEHVAISADELAADRAEVAGTAPSSVPAGDLKQDSAWQALFDEADKSVASDLSGRKKK